MGTPYFICPEIYLKKPYSSTSDIWSLGGVLYNLAALHPPFLADKCVCLSVCGAGAARDSIRVDLIDTYSDLTNFCFFNHKPDSIQNLRKAVVKGTYDALPAVYGASLGTLIGRFLQLNPSDRPEAKCVRTIYLLALLPILCLSRFDPFFLDIF